MSKIRSLFTNENFNIWRFIITTIIVTSFSVGVAWTTANLTLEAIAKDHDEDIEQIFEKGADLRKEMEAEIKRSTDTDKEQTEAINELKLEVKDVYKDTQWLVRFLDK